MSVEGGLCPSTTTTHPPTHPNDRARTPPNPNDLKSGESAGPTRPGLPSFSTSPVLPYTTIPVPPTDVNPPADTAAVNPDDRGFPALHDPKRCLT